MRSIQQFMKKTSGGALVLICICILVLAPLSPAGDVQKAHALPVVVIGGTGTIQETISAGANTVVAGFQEAFFIKEFTFDGIAHGLAKMVLKSMTQSILNWINSGFEGKPAFVTDLKQFVRDRIDQTVGEFIYNDPALNFLCSPFQLDVKIALALSYQDTVHDGTTAQCTLSEVTDNVEGFLSGSFSEGGWESWFELTQNPVNTPTGALLEAKSEMYMRIIDEQGNTIKELDWGDGFLSFKVCSDTSVATGAQKNCDITTPGKVIADQINKSLGAGQDELIAADEINEIISALFAQLAQKAITGANGLLGISNGTGYTDHSLTGSTTSGSYLDALREEATISEGIYDPFTAALKRERENTTLQQQVIALVDSAEASLDSAIAQEGSCITTDLPAALITRRDNARLRIIKNNLGVTMLTTMQTTYNDTFNPQVKLDSVTELLLMQQNGTVTSITENGLLKVDVDYILKEDVDTFKDTVRTAINRCDNDD